MNDQDDERARAPHLPLHELEAILVDVTEILDRLSHRSIARAFDLRIVQCRVAIAACRRFQFSPPLRRALSSKVLELESDALVLRRALRAAAAKKTAARKAARGNDLSESRRFDDTPRGPRARDARVRSD